MMFGMQRSAQLEAAQIADAHARLQKRMEDDPRVPSMQPGGRAVVPGLTDAPAPGPAPAFVYGQGGARLTPDQMADRQRLAARDIAAGTDTSPVQHWTQGLARIVQALAGTGEMRRLNRAQQQNADETASVAQLLAAGAGTDPTAYNATLLGAAANPYIDPTVRGLAANERERMIKADAPEYFMSGGDRVRYDPRSGQSTVVYDAPADFEAYASSLGLQPGTPEYNTAVQDFTLRGNGPTAHGFDTSLEEDRQANREDLENQRQSHRLNLRGTPSYSDLHPRARASSGAGRSSAPRMPTMAGAMAPILSKVARGESLTPGEQQAWSMYRPPNRGKQGQSVAGALVSGGTGSGAGAGPVRIKTKEDYARLPAGTAFIDPTGVQRVKGR